MDNNKYIIKTKIKPCLTQVYEQTSAGTPRNVTLPVEELQSVQKKRKKKISQCKKLMKSFLS